MKTLPNILKPHRVLFIKETQNTCDTQRRLPPAAAQWRDARRLSRSLSEYRAKQRDDGETRSFFHFDRDSPDW